MLILNLFPWFQSRLKAILFQYLWMPLRYLTRNIVKLFGFHYNFSGKAGKENKPKPLHHEQQPDTVEMVIVGTIKSVYKEKFGTPRQGNLVPHGRGCLVLDKRAVDIKWSLDAMNEFSHVWILFVFHANTNVKGKKTPNSKVRPPQGAGAKVGVFATRSPHRPNPIGLSMAKITKVDCSKGIIYLEGLDLCDGTPVVDVKPYCENVDWPGFGVAVTPQWVTNPKFERSPVTFSQEALNSLSKYVDDDGICEWYGKGESEIARRAIEEIISLDPRDLSRGRGTFAAPDEEIRESLPVKETSFTRREERIRSQAATRLVFVHFDELDVTFRPDDATRSFHVTAIDRFKDRPVKSTKAKPANEEW